MKTPWKLLFCLCVPLSLALGLFIGVTLRSPKSPPAPDLTWSQLFAMTPEGKQIEKEIRVLESLGLDRADAEDVVWSKLWLPSVEERGLMEETLFWETCGLDRAAAERIAKSRVTTLREVGMDMPRRARAFKALGLDTRAAWEAAWSQLLGTTAQEFQRRWGNRAPQEFARFLAFYEAEAQLQRAELNALVADSKKRLEESQRLLDESEARRQARMERLRANAEKAREDFFSAADELGTAVKHIQEKWAEGGERE